LIFKKGERMTVKKAYQTLVITILLMMTTIMLYALNVSKLNLEWGMTGFTISAVLSIFSIILSVHTITHHREVKNTGFFALRRYEILDWFTFLAVSLMAIFMVFMFFILPSDVSQSSMKPTLLNGDRILIYHFQYQPANHDIVVLRIDQEEYPLVPNDSFIDDNGVIHDEIFFVKRIMAMPGDLVEFVNFNLSTNKYTVQINSVIARTPQMELYYVSPEQVVILESFLENGILDQGMYLTFGDNASGSLDSRSIGAIQEKDILGKVIFRLWPLGGVS
jgi:signal peptidase I